MHVSGLKFRIEQILVDVSFILYTNSNLCTRLCPYVQHLCARHVLSVLHTVYLRVIARVQGLIVVWPKHWRRSEGLLASDLAIPQLILEQRQ